jgi:hypothetical protein
MGLCPTIISGEGDLASRSLPVKRLTREDTFTIVAFAALLAVVVRMAMLAWDGSYYSPDSFWYYDLSRTVFDDPYRLHTVGSFGSSADYGAPFPPGWPVALAVGDRLLGAGIRTGLILNVLLTLVAALLAERFFRRRFGAPAFGVMSVVALCAFPQFADELVAGRAAPATIVLLVALLLLLPISAMSNRAMALLGTVLAGFVLVRFDWLWPALVLPALLFLASRRRTYALLTCYATLLLLLVPWIVQSLTRLGVPFAADGSFVGLSVRARHPTDYVPHDITLFDDPLGWVDRVAGNLGFGAKVVGLVAWNVGPALMGLLAGLGLGAAALRLRGGSPASEDRWSREPKPRQAPAFWRQGAVLVALLAAQMAFAPLVFRLGDVRYWCLIIYVAIVAACLLFLDRAPLEPDRRRNAAAVAAGVSVLGGVALLAVGPLARISEEPSFADQAADRTLVARCVERDRALMVLGDDRFAAQLGALTRQRVLFEPRNLEELTPTEVRKLLVDFRVRHFFVPAGAPPPDRVRRAFKAADPAHRGLRRDPCARGLYRGPVPATGAARASTDAQEGAPPGVGASMGLYEQGPLAVPR